MTDDHHPQTPITQIAPTDQALAELRDTASRVAGYYSILVAGKIPVEIASQMALEYNQRLLNRHFGTTTTMFMMPMYGGDE